jgi:hypothetical protein
VAVSENILAEMWHIALASYHSYINYILILHPYDICRFRRAVLMKEATPCRISEQRLSSSSDRRLSGIPLLYFVGYSSPGALES